MILTAPAKSLATWLLFVSACYTTSAQTTSPDGVAVRVVNQHPQDLKIYAYTPGQRIRIGTAASMQITTLRIPAAYGKQAGGLRIECAALGGGASFTFPAVVVGPGETLVLQVQPALQLSTYMVLKQRP